MTARCVWDGCGRVFDTDHAMRTHHAQVHGAAVAVLLAVYP